MVLNYLKFSAGPMLLSCLGTVAMIMSDLSWSVLLEWSWTDWNCYNVPMVLEWTSFDDCVYLTGISEFVA